MPQQFKGRPWIAYARDWISISAGGLPELSSPVACPPHHVEHLSDNGSCYTAGETRDFARQLGLVPCFKPVRAPESNGMAEAFVKTLKRDYVRITPLPDAVTALGLVSAWIDDYNTVHPHSALAMRSPVEFRSAFNPSQAVR